MLPLALGYLGFASNPAGTTGAECGDIPDSVVIGLTGETCSSLAAAGRCTSTDGVVAKLMASSCQASCGTCDDSARASRAYSKVAGAGDHTCKMWEQNGNRLNPVPLDEDAATKLMCGALFNLFDQTINAQVIAKVRAAASVDEAVAAMEAEVSRNSARLAIREWMDEYERAAGR